MPSFQTDSPLDYRVKRGLLVDCMRTLCLSIKRKRKYKIDKRARLTDRLMMKPTRQPNAAPDKANAGGNGDNERKTEFTKIELQS